MLVQTHETFDESDHPFELDLEIDERTVMRLACAVLFDSGGLSRFLQTLPQTVSRVRLLQFLGVADVSPDPTAIREIGQRLAARRDEVGRFDGRFGGDFDRSLNLFASQVGLSSIEERLLGFASLLYLRPCLAKLASKAFGEVEHIGLVKVAARILGCNEAQMRTALAPNGTLVRSGLVSVKRGGRVRLHDHFELLPGVIEALCGGERAIAAFLERWVPEAAPPSLTLRDYPHLRLAVGLARKTLAAVLRSKAVGVNLLLYGPPGSGKSELARALAADLGVALYAVPCADEQGDPLDGAKRMRAYRLAQNVLARREGALLLFDEVEDVFPTRLSIRRCIGTCL